jgi:phosphatidylglycerophosphate synthase
MDESVLETIRRLASAQKPAAKGAPAYSRFVNRKIGRVLAAVGYHAGLTPNQVTGISALLTTASIVGIATVRPTPLSGVLIALGLLLGYAFDSADGQLARLRGGGSPGGEWLDHVVDAVKECALHLAVLVCWFRFYDLSPTTLLIPIGFTLAASVLFFAQILTEQLRRAHPEHAPAPAGSGLTAVARSVLVIPTDYGLYCLVFILLAWPGLFVPAYSILAVGTAALVIAALPKWFREMSALPGR